MLQLWRVLGNEDKRLDRADRCVACVKYNQDFGILYNYTSDIVFDCMC